MMILKDKIEIENEYDKMKFEETMKQNIYKNKAIKEAHEKKKREKE